MLPLQTIHTGIVCHGTERTKIMIKTVESYGPGGGTISFLRPSLTNIYGQHNIITVDLTDCVDFFGFNPNDVLNACLQSMDSEQNERKVMIATDYDRLSDSTKTEFEEWMKSHNFENNENFDIYVIRRNGEIHIPIIDQALAMTL